MAAPANEPGPIALQGTLHETLWGGRHLATIAGKSLPPIARIGETWETELNAIAINAPYTGRTLGDLCASYGARLYGTRAVAVYGERFPLLAKFIDARQQLSVQVHPDDAYAAAHEGGKLGKTEVWYILHAEPTGSVVYGVRRATSGAEVREAIAANRLEDLLRAEPVRAGDVLLVEAGTVHAIGAGVVLYELQEYSDITYRLYDYGRLQVDGLPRALHIDSGLAVMRFNPPAATFARPLALPAAGPMARRVLAGCRYFVLEEALLDGVAHGNSDPASCQIVTMLAGRLEIAARGGECALTLGETAVLPAAMGAYHLAGRAARFMCAYVPREDDAALRAWGAAQSPSVEGRAFQ